MRPGRAVWLLLAALFVVSSPIRAEPTLSDYEKESIRLALEDVGGEVEPAPLGKRVEGIDVVTLEVFERRDPLPGWVNWFHATTRAGVIEREMLIHPGDRYAPALVEETERNLRAARQLSVVVIVPTKAKTPGQVRLLVVTKDVWSLRVNWDVVFVNGRVQTLALQPSEENLLGRHKSLVGNVIFTPATYSLGIGFIDPRIGGSRLQASASANVTFNCRTNQAEGSSGAFQYGKPLYSVRTRWSWVAAAGWSEGVVRPGGTFGQSLCSDDRAVALDFLSTRGQDAVPYQYRQDIVRGQISATRSFGIATKNDVSFGLETNRRAFESPDLSARPQSVRDGFSRLLPVNDTRISPFVQLHGYENRYLRVLDFETLGLQEDYILGHDVWLRGYPGAKSLGSTRDLVGLFSGAGYTVGLGDGLLRAYVASTIELSTRDQTDAALDAALRFVTPRLPFGRFVFDGRVVDRYRNYLNSSLALGGTTRLRGYRTLAFVGPDVVVGNVELRSRPIEILSVQVGAAAFYDVGDAFRGFSNLSLKQGAGAGLRFAFPQVQRTVLRVDVAFPLTRGDPAGEDTLLVKFEQAFGMPQLQLIAPGFVQ
jgi:hypothetical protein